LADVGAMNLVPDVFSENALETALQFGGRITALSFGAPSAGEVLRKALAMKAEAAGLVVNDVNQHPDPRARGQALAAAAGEARGGGQAGGVRSDRYGP